MGDELTLRGERHRMDPDEGPGSTRLNAHMLEAIHVTSI